MAGPDILERLREAAKRRVLFLPHAVRQMLRPDRMISRMEVRRVINGGFVVEDYPEDARGHSCLLLGFGEGKRPIHVVCAPKEEYLAVITAHVPDRHEWDKDYRTRLKS